MKTETQSTLPLPLQGERVLDLSRLLPGPYCSMLLADMGAEVIKIEEPGKGDYIRASAPFIKGESSGYLVLNRNKKSITLDLKPMDLSVFSPLFSCIY